MTATTALTAQNTLGVAGIQHTPPDFVAKQIDACIGDIGVDIVKVGMLASKETIEVVAKALERHNRPAVVVDPVMVSTTGAQLLPEEAVSTLRTDFLPLTTVLTPNIPEARLLLQNANVEIPETKTLDDVINLARGLQNLGPRFVLVKGGHLTLAKHDLSLVEGAKSSTVADVLFDGQKTTIFEKNHIDSKNTHGTGCSLACKCDSFGSYRISPNFPPIAGTRPLSITDTDIDYSCHSMPDRSSKGRISRDQHTSSCRAGLQICRSWYQFWLRFWAW